MKSPRKWTVKESWLAILVSALPLMAAVTMWTIQTFGADSPEIPTPYQPKYLAGQCIVLPVKPLTLLRIEMVDREAALYLVRTTPASIYRTQIGMVVEAQTIDQFKPTLCPNQT
jgi:hypothetical protein